MSAVKWLSGVAVTALVVLLATAWAEDAPKVKVEVRADDGSVWIAADEIVSYMWESHTLKLKPGVRAKLKERLLESKRLVSGVPFSMAVDGKTVYQGQFTSINSSISQNAIVIVIDLDHLDRSLTKDQLRIDTGYPGKEFYTGTDPRFDARLRKALAELGKLDHEPTHVEWVAATLKDIETLKPGMTRAQLLGLFQEEGGLSNRQSRRYAYRNCPYFKVDATFEPVGQPDDETTNRPEDKIVSLSKPFLECPIED